MLYMFPPKLTSWPVLTHVKLGLAQSVTSVKDSQYGPLRNDRTERFCE